MPGEKGFKDLQGGGEKSGGSSAETQ